MKVTAIAENKLIRKSIVKKIKSKKVAAKGTAISYLATSPSRSFGIRYKAARNSNILKISWDITVII